MPGIISRIFGKDIETIQSVAEDIAETSLVCGQTFVDNMATGNNGSVTSNSNSGTFAVNECMYFLLHYVSRLVFSVGGVAAQGKICNDISLYAVAKLASSLPENARADFFSILQEGINEAELEYSKCKRLTLEGDDSPAGTLFWEASKRISASAGGGMDIANIIVATKVITAALSSLKLEGRIKALVSSVK